MVFNAHFQMKAKTTAAMTTMMMNGKIDQLQYVIKRVRRILEDLYICTNISSVGLISVTAA